MITRLWIIVVNYWCKVTWVSITEWWMAVIALLMSIPELWIPMIIHRFPCLIASGFPHIHICHWQLQILDIHNSIMDIHNSKFGVSITEWWITIIVVHYGYQITKNYNWVMGFLPLNFRCSSLITDIHNYSLFTIHTFTFDCLHQNCWDNVSVA